MPRIARSVCLAVFVASVATTCVPALIAAQGRSRPGEVPVAARLRALEDREEIRLLLLDYGRHLDSRDLKSYAGLFAMDGEWVGGFGTVKGRDAIQAFMEKNMGTGPNTANNYHLLSNFVITVTGDTATAWSRWAFVVPGPPRLEVPPLQT